jgi:hypothetical protein
METWLPAVAAKLLTFWPWLQVGGGKLDVKHKDESVSTIVVYMVLECATGYKA